MPALTDWMDRNSASLFLSVITIAEVEDGIAKSRRLGARRKAEQLSAWLETVLHLYAARVLPSTWKQHGASAFCQTMRAVRVRRPAWPTLRLPPRRRGMGIPC